MKITIILLTVLCLHVSARSWSQKVTLSVKNMPLQKVFTLIEKQTGYAFFYDLDLLNGRTASLDVKDAEITAVLKECLRDLPLDFKVVNTTIAIIKRQPPKIVAELAPAPRSETEVKGQVKTEAGAPMPDATVTLISGKIRKSIATNAEGEFVVPDLPKGKYTMEITFIGYETFRREVIIGDQPIEVSAILKAAISGLDETVVKGYYNTTKRLNTGNVTTVKGEDIQKQPVSDPILALEGRAPGLYISQYSGIPGAGLIVQLRGQN
ncbi:MAG TPA: carboxypeptidase regulatory-like domain-containing protein, partial [Puia sp.]|nr:carboxypeptidase regulatory-like domain-containing protein [Puia sp.]